MKIDVPDVLMIVITIVGIGLIIYILRIILTMQSSPEYVTYEEFHNSIVEIYKTMISLVGMMVASNGVIWYKLGRIEQRLGIGKSSRVTPE